MRAATLLCLSIAAAAMPAVAIAQSTDREWLDDCQSNNYNDRETFCEVRLAGFKLGGRPLSVDAGPNGGISIVAWDGDSVEVHERIQAQASSRSDAAEIARGIRVSTDDATIRGSGPSTRNRESWSITYLIFVPRAATLTLETENGPIGITGTSGRVNARTVNGPLALRGLSGEVRARTSNGPLQVSLTGRRWEGGSLDAETRNGPATIQIPDGYSAHLITGTVNGPMRFDFPLTLQGRISSHIETDLGSGGATVKATTTNGPLVLRRT